MKVHWVLTREKKYYYVHFTDRKTATDCFAKSSE